LVYMGVEIEEKIGENPYIESISTLEKFKQWDKHENFVMENLIQVAHSYTIVV
jgi:hypothetical protein